MKQPCVHIRFVLCLLLLLTAGAVAAQERGPYDTVRVYAFVTDNGDTIPGSILPPVEVRGYLTGKWKRRYEEWTRLRNAVYVTYPYALRASRIMNEINRQLEQVSDRKQRKTIIRSREKDLKKEFADKLTQLSVYQGKVLMKLIYRETGNNCYEIIEEYKGVLNAAFWQTIAVLFGSNLKQQYDGYGKDIEMERIVRDVERMYGVRG
ncbi:MAG: DUF4294 domain-containing protein [Chitinophagaceae bacterium]|jgi:hypothetical protein|nr:DUF4294 domain-containing protein [Chitinophagaceae bacterium]